ncbi:hypothetical protein HYH03_015090 [Edaphochlamys debaryana]|uniref:Uncharacterized protein n=1 Tax=Edaphochlamys debaryana TaxID=47281 RepID=A0A836BRC7_9CHLO|nr:hypothetical protein HYH03_015090 [Edaphochlamys debaryana]|eukprot:KAG2486266.1 hypothetical protein HYH03_015090 [Edaphochlamys debaryana]
MLFTLDEDDTPFCVSAPDASSDHGGSIVLTRCVAFETTRPDSSQLFMPAAPVLDTSWKVTVPDLGPFDDGLADFNIRYSGPQWSRISLHPSVYSQRAVQGGMSPN